MVLCERRVEQRRHGIFILDQQNTHCPFLMRPAKDNHVAPTLRFIAMLRQSNTTTQTPLTIIAIKIDNDRPDTKQ
jgi:hypothetical protein